jgi:hypothetical protein
MVTLPMTSKSLMNLKKRVKTYFPQVDRAIWRELLTHCRGAKRRWRHAE